MQLPNLPCRLRCSQWQLGSLRLVSPLPSSSLSFSVSLCLSLSLSPCGVVVVLLCCVCVWCVRGVMCGVVYVVWHRENLVCPLRTCCVYDKTSPCMLPPPAHVENTCTRGAGAHGFFPACHTQHTHHNPPQQYDHTTRRDSLRETETQRDRERKQEEDKTTEEKRQDKKRKDKKRKEKTRQ